MANKTSQHILGTSANLLGFCLFVITSLHISNYSANSIIDEFTSLVALMLIFSCLFSFFSMQALNETWKKRLEKIADYLFAFALVGILIIVLFVALNIVK